MLSPVVSIVDSAQGMGHVNTSEMETGDERSLSVCSAESVDGSRERLMSAPSVTPRDFEFHCRLRASEQWPIEAFGRLLEAAKVEGRPRAKVVGFWGAGQARGPAARRG